MLCAPPAFRSWSPHVSPLLSSVPVNVCFSPPGPSARADPTLSGPRVPCPALFFPPCRPRPRGKRKRKPGGDDNCSDHHCLLHNLVVGLGCSSLDHTAPLRHWSLRQDERQPYNTSKNSRLRSATAKVEKSPVRGFPCCSGF